MPCNLFYVYMLSFDGTDRVYIGYTSRTPEVRFNWHWKSRNAPRHRNVPLYKYLRRIEKTDVTVSTLYISTTKEDALAAECSLIAQKKSLITESGFNATTGGENPPPGFGGCSWRAKYTDEELKEIDSRKARHGQDNGFYGKTHSQDTLKRAVQTRRENGSYDENTGKHLHTSEMRKKTIQAQKDGAARRYGYENDEEFVRRILDIYQECGGSYRWIAAKTNSNRPTIRKRVSMILDGEYGEVAKSYIEECMENIDEWKYMIERSSRESFERLFIYEVDKPDFKETELCHQ